MRRQPASSKRHPVRTALTAAVAALALAACDQGATTTQDQGTDPADAAPGGMPAADEGAMTGTGGTAGTTGGDAAGDTAGVTGGAPAFMATIQDAEGAEVGTAEFTEADGAMAVHVQVTGMDPGFYGLHVHAIGECEPGSAAPDDPSNTGDFMSAGGHIGVDETEHPGHAGDLPSLLVMDSGEAWLTAHTDRLTGEQLEDEDAAALIIHGSPDNFANIPERYAPDGPDQDTLDTGDAGDRLACGVISAAG